MNKNNLMIDAGSIMKDFAAEYGQHVISNLFPHAIDGLKKVHKRVLWAFINLPNHEKVGGIMLTGEVIKYHPYGDNAISNAIIHMSQPFNVNIPLIKCNGNVGSYANDSPAAMRYLDFTLPEFTKDMFINGIELKSLPMEATETAKTFAPVYFIPKLPMALIWSNTTIGYGESSYTVAYAIESVAAMVKSFIEDRAKAPNRGWDFRRVAKEFTPFYPVTQHLRNRDEILNAISTVGDFTIKPVVEGVISIESMYPLVVHVHTTPPGINFDTVQKNALAELRRPNSLLSKSISDTGLVDSSNTNMAGDIVITFKRNIDIGACITELKSVINTVGTMSVIPNYMVEDKLITLTPVNLMDMWHGQRYQSIISKKKAQHVRLANRLRVLEIKILVADKIDEVISIIKNNDNETGIKKLIDTFKLTMNQALILLKIPLGELSRTNKMECIDQKVKTEKELSDLLSSFSSIDDEIYADAEYFAKTYGNKDQGMYTPKYIGYIKVDGLYIQVEKIEEVEALLLMSKREAEVYLYPKNAGTQRYTENRNVVNIRSKFTRETPTPTSHIKYTAVLEKGKDGRRRVMYVPGYYDVPNAYHLDKKDIVLINKDGTVTAGKIQELIRERKSIKSDGALTDCIYIYPDNKYPALLFTMNTSIPNVLRVQKVTNATSKIMLTFSGDTKFMGYVPVSMYDKYVIRLDVDCLSRCINKYIVLNIKNLDKVLTHEHVDLSTKVETKGYEYKLI